MKNREPIWKPDASAQLYMKQQADNMHRMIKGSRSSIDNQLSEGVRNYISFMKNKPKGGMTNVIEAGMNAEQMHHHNLGIRKAKSTLKDEGQMSLSETAIKFYEFKAQEKVMPPLFLDTPGDYYKKLSPKKKKWMMRENKQRMARAGLKVPRSISAPPLDGAPPGSLVKKLPIHLARPEPIVDRNLVEGFVRATMYGGSNMDVIHRVQEHVACKFPDIYERLEPPPSTPPPPTATTVECSRAWRPPEYSASQVLKKQHDQVKAQREASLESLAYVTQGLQFRRPSDTYNSSSRGHGSGGGYTPQGTSTPGAPSSRGITVQDEGAVWGMMMRGATVEAEKQSTLSTRPSFTEMLRTVQNEACRDHNHGTSHKPNPNPSINCRTYRRR